jgi:hypothetical protein
VDPCNAAVVGIPNLDSVISGIELDRCDGPYVRRQQIAMQGGPFWDRVLVGGGGNSSASRPALEDQLKSPYRRIFGRGGKREYYE